MKKNSKQVIPKRNPYAVPALQRRAGQHRKSNKALRQQEKQELKRLRPLYF